MKKPTGKLAFAYQTIMALEAKMARLAEENERLQAEVARLNKAIDNCTGGSLTSCCCNFNDA